MGTWQESEHPRDDEGKFTFKNGGASSGGSNSNSLSREDILYPTMKDKEPNYDFFYKGLGNYGNNDIQREDILFPTMKNKRDEGILTGGAASINPENLNYNNIKNMAQTENDRNFFLTLEKVFDSEGKYSNKSQDKGGPTNMGITQSTYNDYCRRHNLPNKNVKNLSKEETIQVYYNDYWLKSGLDKEKDPIKSLIIFDTAVLHGVGRAKQFLRQSNGDLNKFLELRREYNKNTVEKHPDQKEFEKGWYNRIDRLEKILKRYESVKGNKN